jgi:hypothetical protein
VEFDGHAGFPILKALTSRSPELDGLTTAISGRVVPACAVDGAGSALECA